MSELLCLFLKNSNCILPGELIFGRLWDGNGSCVDDNTLSVYIRRLRRKIKDDSNVPTKLLTEIGFGYPLIVYGKKLPESNGGACEGGE